MKVQHPQWRQWGWLLFLFVWLLGLKPAAAPLRSLPPPITDSNNAILSPLWKPIIQQWAEEIKVVSDWYGLDPDLIAAVINAESNGVPDLVSRAGAVGLMGVLPAGPGMEWRPSPEALKTPTVNLQWGGAILADIMQQAGGDIAAALAAYSGGWENATRRVPQEYATRVLNEYGRAVVVRSGLSPDIASQWTITVILNRGNIAPETSGFVANPATGIFTLSEHIVFKTTTADGTTIYIKGYATPVVLIVPQATSTAIFNTNHTLDPHLIARAGLSDVKINEQNPRVLLACLPGLSRLRGQLSTRWYAPSGCPSWNR
ncbi:MAG: transglycosylase SLT domain-containing protein [Chloroflexi bacterium]|nr:transglycosylase SLT domain-containing protein [Chloroflexota bacterium]MBP8058974.1 transglycosylase SLT domain-containing protein [Chloroflexota bacterium]